MLLLALVMSMPQEGPPLPFKNPLPKDEQIRKFHLPEVIGNTWADRESSYKQRLSMEAASPFRKLTWRNIGPTVQGGRVATIASPEKDPNSLYVAYSTSGLWRTTDDGNSWQSLFNHEAAFGIGDFALSKDGKTIWVGTGEANSQRTSYAGTGIYKSVDSGKTWQWMGLPESHHIGRVVIDPRDENTVYACVMGHLYSQNPERGLYRTRDGGKTWEQILKIDQWTGVIDMCIDPRNSNVLYASAWHRDRRSWDFLESGPGSGVYKSVDGGKSWTKLTGGLPYGAAAGRTAIAIAPSKPDRLYAFVDNEDPADFDEYEDEGAPSGKLTLRRFVYLTDELLYAVPKDEIETFIKRWVKDSPEDVLKKIAAKTITQKEVAAMIQKDHAEQVEIARKQAEIYRSDDGGKTWVKPYQGRIGEHGGYYWNRLFVNPRDADDVFSTGVYLLRSKNAGKQWNEVATWAQVHVDYHFVYFDPRNPKRFITGTDGGVFISGDDGGHFRHIENMPVGQVTTLAIDEATPYRVIAGMQDNGTLRGPNNWKLGSSDVNDWKELFGGDGSAIAVDPRKDRDLVYVSYQFGMFFAVDKQANKLWSTRPEPPKGAKPYRYNWIAPFIVSSHHPDIVYVGTEKLLRSFDQGKHYTEVSPDLTTNREQGNVPHATLKDISESPLQFGLIYVGTDDGLVKMTPDGGYQWIDISTPLKGKWVTRVVASKWDKATVYCAQSGYREDDFNAYLWVSTDYGKTWKSISAGLPAETINVVREDPNNKGVLYVGTDMGAFISQDNGATWEALSGNIPHAPIHDLQVQAKEKELVVGTHSRSVWILPLKYVLGLTPEIRKMPVHLFKPDKNSVYTNYKALPLKSWHVAPDEIPTMAGMMFAGKAGKAVIVLKDDKGKEVARQELALEEGLNPYSLSLLLAPSKPAEHKKRTIKSVEDALKDPLEEERPHFVVPGSYKLEVTLNGATESLDVKVETGFVPSRDDDDGDGKTKDVDLDKPGDSDGGR
ncbi:MAG: glycosyl hydrolase [Armatimonadetes bacterium]|nr:glycosyl hydrolase [Armatimonadota bacterium]